MNKRFARRLLCFVVALALMVPVALTMGADVSAATAQIRLNKKNVTLYVGEKYQMESYGTTKAITWKTADETIATVSKSGLVTAVKAGTVKITATSNDKSYTCTVKVINPSLSEKKVTINIGERKDVSLNGTKAKSVSSSDKKIVTVKKNDDAYDYHVQENGSSVSIRGIAKGTATVTVKGENGKSYKLEVTVAEPTVLTKEVFEGNGYSTTETYKYDKYGNRIYELSETDYGKSLTESTYYSDGTMKSFKRTNYDENGNLSYIWSEEYDKHGWVTSSMSAEYYDGELSYASSYECEYDENGREISRTSYRDIEKKDKYYEQKTSYNANGTKKSMYTYEKSYDGIVIENKTECYENGLSYKTEEYTDGVKTAEYTYYYVGVGDTDYYDDCYGGYLYQYRFVVTDNKEYWDSCKEIKTDKDGRVIKAVSSEGTYEFKYNKDGKLVYEAYPDWNERPVEKKTEYDDKGREVSYEYWVDGKLDEKRISKYDNNGNRVYYYTEDGYWIREENRTYDKNGRITSESVKTVYGEDEESISKTEYTYDEKGNCIKEYSTYTEYDGSVSDSTITRTYDKNGRLTSVVKDGKYEKVTETYKYNSYGKMTSYVKNVDGADVRTEAYKYDVYGNNTYYKFVDVEEYASSKYVYVTETTKKYDANANLTSSVTVVENTSSYGSVDSPDYEVESYGSTTEDRYENGILVYESYTNRNAYDGEENKEVTERTYNSKGEPLTSTRTNSYSTSNQVYTYDDNGLLTKKVSEDDYSSGGDKKSETVYTYDKSGKLKTEKETEYVDGEKTYEAVTTYDANGNIISFEDKYSKYTYTYKLLSEAK